MPQPPTLSPLFLPPFSSSPVSHVFFSDLTLKTRFNHQKNKIKQNKNTWVPSKILILQKALKIGFH